MLRWIGALAVAAGLCAVSGGMPATAATGSAEPDSADLIELDRITMATSPMQPQAPALPVLSQSASAPPPHFAFLYEDPLGERIDTIAGTVTKWLGTGRDTTISVRLSADELEAVNRKMVAIRFFAWSSEDSSRWWEGNPDGLHFEPFDALRGRGEWASLYARSDTTITRVRWPWFMRFNVGSPDMARLQQLVNLVWFEVSKHAEYRALPPARYSTY